MRYVLSFMALLVCVGLLSVGCTESDADVASKNLSTAAEQFEVPRRIVFINGITDKYIVSIEGYCSIDAAGSGLSALAVVCRDGNDEKFTVKKFFFGKSDNSFYTVEQLQGVRVSTNHVRVIFKPETIVPDFDRP